ncbi:hypothetical protein [Nocardia xishanensis]
MLAFAWREPRLDPDSPGAPLPAFARTVVDSAAMRALLGGLGLLGALAVLAVGFFGSSDSARNPVPGIVYIFVWVGVMVASLALGPVWKILSPTRALHRVICRTTGRPPERGALPYPEA